MQTSCVIYGWFDIQYVQEYSNTQRMCTFCKSNWKFESSLFYVLRFGFSKRFNKRGLLLKNDLTDLTKSARCCPGLYLIFFKS